MSATATLELEPRVVQSPTVRRSGREVLAALRRIPIFAGLPEEECWIGDVDELTVTPGEVLVREGEMAQHFYVLTDGEMRVTKRSGDQEHLIATHRSGSFFGEIPLLLDAPFFVTSTAAVESRILCLPKEALWMLLRSCPLVAREIVRTVIIRLRNLEGWLQQHEKLASLGTMAAGLAHELNNPAAASRRAAAHLSEALSESHRIGARLNEQLDYPHWDRLIDFMNAALRDSAPAHLISAVELNDAEDLLATWLEDHGISNGWEAAPALAAVQVKPEALSALAADLPTSALEDVISWLAVRFSTDALLRELEQSTGRLAELVSAVRSYSGSSNNDAPPAELDVHEGLESTLVMLNHKLKGLEITREYDRALPRITGYTNELSQVWTNLLDNAADAAGEGGKLEVRTRRDGNQVVVEIADNGSGISPENLTRIFEPFFTTKGVGAGTGLGLVISHRIVADRHGGEIEVESRPGDTRFFVRLPIRRAETVQAERATAAAAANAAVEEGSGSAFLETQLQSGPMEPHADPQVAELPAAGEAESYATIFDIPLFSQLNAEGRAALATGEEFQLAPGELVIREGETGGLFVVVLSGELRVTKRFGAQEVVLATQPPGAYMGEIQLMTDTTFAASAYALGEVRMVRLTREAFWQLLRSSPEVGNEIVRTLVSRVRNFEGYSQQRERLASLGALAAGLAQELSGPARESASAAKALRGVVHGVEISACRLTDEIDSSGWAKLEKLPAEAAVPENELPPPAAELAREWHTGRGQTAALVRTIEQSARRISELVKAVKAYSYMDRAPLQEADVHEGLENTLTMLAHRLEGVQVNRDYDRQLPMICCYGSELNQVWTHLFTNAADALNGSGEIVVQTSRVDGHVAVEITDSGPGIPEAIRSRIFEPFFSTKGMYDRNGLGLLISHRIVTDRHGGSITFDSQPGRTSFRVVLPIEPPKRAISSGAPIQ